MMFGFPAQQFVTYRGRRGIDLGDDDAAGSKQVGSPSQCSHRVTPDADVAVGEQNLFPTAFGGQRREKVSGDRSSAALTGQLDRSARRVDPKRGKPALLSGSGETPRAAT